MLQQGTDLDAAIPRLQVAHDSINAAGLASAALGPPDLRPATKTLQELPDCISDLHHGMSRDLKDADMRLIRISAMLDWPSLKVYEEVSPADCMQQPYKAADEETWSRTVVLSWRWGSPKPETLQPGFSPMTQPQMAELTAVLRYALDAGLQFAWIDWCCVPQYSDGIMVEVLRSKVYYARAAVMVVLPTFHAISGNDIVQVILQRTLAALQGRTRNPADRRSHAHMLSTTAATVMESIIDKGTVASNDYFGRAWTLAERMARFGRDEHLCQWLSLEAWLGMIVDSMVHSTQDVTGSKMYRDVLGKDGSQLLDSITTPLGVAMKTDSLMPTSCKGLELKLADLFELATVSWCISNIESEGPTVPWLIKYLQHGIGSGFYDAFSKADLVWCIYSYYSWRQLDMSSSAGIKDALDILADVAEIPGGRHAWPLETLELFCFDEVGGNRCVDLCPLWLTTSFESCCASHASHAMHR